MAGTEENIERLRLAILQSPNRSIQLRAYNLNLSQTEVYNEFLKWT